MSPSKLNVIIIMMNSTLELGCRLLGFTGKIQSLQSSVLNGGIAPIASPWFLHLHNIMYIQVDWTGFNA